MRLLLIFNLLLLASCQSKTAEKSKLSSVILESAYGFKESLDSPEKVKAFENFDETKTQSYKKITRNFQNPLENEKLAIISEYYPSGQIKTRIETKNLQAKGLVQEWHKNGKLKLKAQVLGGNPEQRDSWIFDKSCEIFYESGDLQAKLKYKKGRLEGVSEYYDQNGVLEKSLSFKNGLRNGPSEITNLGKELFENGNLISASYKNHPESIQNGFGTRLIFENSSLVRKEDYANGEQSGRVEVLKEGRVLQSYKMKNGFKNGLEIYFYPNGQKKQSISWVNGSIQGNCEHWYPDAKLKSRYQLSSNEKHGLCTEFHSDESYASIEHYKHGQLIRGRYFKPGSKKAESEVENGSGITSIFDSNGNLEREIEYENYKIKIA